MSPPRGEPGRSRHFVIVNQYASTPETGMGGRHYDFALQMVRMGHRVDLVMAGHHHLLRVPRTMTQPVEIETREGIRLVYVRVGRYRGAHALRRALNWLLFSWRVARLDGHLQGRPDAILASSPSPFTYLGAERLARRQGARLCFEVRDIWPLSLVELGGLSPRNPLIRLMQRAEDRAYRNADEVVAYMPAADEHMVSRGMDARKFTWIANGFTRESVEGGEPLDPAVAALFSGGFTVGYAGTLGLANALDTLIDAAERLREHTDIRFVLVGDGRDRARLERRVAELGLTSVLFAGAIARRQIPSALSRFDACYIGWQHKPIYRFGIAANKLAEYMIAARPVLHGYCGHADPVAAAGCGLSPPAGDADALAAAILRMRVMPPAERTAMGARGAAYAARHFDNAKNVRRLIDLLTRE